jgi:hypothetical protein
MEATTRSGSTTIAATASRPRRPAFHGLGSNYRKLVPSVAPSFRRCAKAAMVTIGAAGRAHGHGARPNRACLPGVNVLISGDQVLQITTNVSVWPDQPAATRSSSI